MPECVSLFCATVVLIAKRRCNSLFQHLGLELRIFVCVYLNLTVSVDACSPAQITEVSSTGQTPLDVSVHNHCVTFYIKQILSSELLFLFQ